MSNNKKWKNKKINFETYKNSEIKNVKEKKPLSDSWKVGLTALFLIAIPSFLSFLLLGLDGWVIKETAKWTSSRWTMLLPISLSILIFQFLIISILIWGFKVLKPSSLNFLVAILFSMNSFLVSSGVEVSKWWIRVLPAVGLAFLAIPVIAINRAIAKKTEKKLAIQIEENNKKNKSLLD